MVRQRVYWVAMAAVCGVLSALLSWSGPSSAARQADVRNTKHNLSSIGSQNVRALAGQSEEVCVFCHTPHAATLKDQGSVDLATGDWSPALWNRKIPQGSTYSPYTSNTLDAATIQAGFSGQPGGSSKLCLSCHDGTIAIGNVNVLGGASYSGTPTTTEVIQMQGADPDKTFPGGDYTATSGFTRDLGQTLANDHPISVTFNSALALSDGEIRTPDANQIVSGTGLPAGINQAVGIRNVPAGTRPLLPQEKTGTAGAGQIQCATCHDAHIKDTAADHNIKFLRAERFQVSDPAIGGAGFKADRDIICLACHDKMGTGWAYSAHAHPSVADEKYIETGTPSPASLREFPTGRTVGFRVWEGACLNCHDTHTVQGAKKLLREGTANMATPAKQGGDSAMEQTCYQCHSNTPAVQAGATAFAVPNIAADFSLTRQMPITGAETHDAGGSFDDSAVGGTLALCDPNDTTTQCGKDLMESRANLFQRHAECTDCHNPHRVIKGQGGLPGALSAANTNQKAGTHRHEDATGYTHTNVISGVLRGAWGVEPSYSSNSFNAAVSTITFTVKRGNPVNDSTTDCGGASKAACDGKDHITREYQVCLKCHSNYGYNDDGVYPNSGSRPALGGTGLTPSANTGGRNYTSYTNQAKEFRAPDGLDSLSSHRGPTTAGACLNLGADAGAAAANNNCNHRSWHPVINSTGRNGTVRGNGTDISARWRAPWSNAGAVGSQTMYCSDCHGSDTIRATGGQETAMPVGNTNTDENGNPWGPHGSGNNFILKGSWDQWTGTNGGTGSPRTEQQRTDICFKCHNYATYATNSGQRTGFYNDPTDKNRGDLHSFHAGKIGRMRCSWCHVAVPHGWKNKALLVNLNDVGPEAGLAAGTQVRNGTTTRYTRGPYYMNAVNKIINFRPSGLWRENDCGSKGAPGNGQTGRNWMRDSTENCASPP